MLSQKKILFVSVIINIIFFCLGIYKLANRIINSNTKATSEKAYREDKISQFELLNTESTDTPVFFVGDSMFDRFLVSEYFNSLAARNRGIGNETTALLLSRFGKTVLNGRPKSIFLYIGGNDISRGIALETIVSNISEIVKTAGDRSIKVFLISQLSRGKAYISPNITVENFNKKVLLLNRKMEELCKTAKCNYVDIKGYFEDDENNLSRKYTNDGIHLNGCGYDLFAKKLNDLILAFNLKL